VSGLRLTLKSQPALRVDMRSITPAALQGMSPAQAERLRVGYGASTRPLAEFFAIDMQASATQGSDTQASDTQGSDILVFDGDLSRFDRIGWQMAGGRIVVEGHAGHYAGGCMSAGEVVVNGNAASLAACEMAGGALTIEGNAGDFAASTLPGSMDGMRGGTFIVRGNVGARFGDRMRRGTAIVFGDAGDFLASRMVAGTIALGGAAGAHAAFGMRRGSIVFATQSVPSPASATFVPAISTADVFWQLLARDLSRHGGPFEGLAGKRIERSLGDLSVLGKGELIYPR
jgi:formylmethanofuran dehydrogenase subunit C